MSERIDGKMTALVIGAAGGFGGTAARTLVARGHRVIALMRPGGRRPDVPGARVVEGDALSAQSLRRAAAGVDVIVFGFHVPYTEWDPTAIEAMRVTGEVAASARATVLFPGNVYGLGPDFSEPISEDAPRAARSRKGAIRNRMEALLREATERGARAVVVRAGDYIDPSAENTWLELMATRAVRGGAFFDTGEPGVLHAWAYLPDVVRAGVCLLERRQSLAAFEDVHVDGYTVTMEELVTEVRAVLGRAMRVRRFPWWLVRLASFVSPLLREVLEMRYLWTEPVRLDGAKLRRLLPDFRLTPLSRAMVESLAGIASRRGVALSDGEPSPVANAT